jgi:hypothetical protein
MTINFETETFGKLTKKFKIKEIDVIKILKEIYKGKFKTPEKHKSRTEFLEFKGKLYDLKWPVVPFLAFAGFLFQI